MKKIILIIICLCLFAIPVSGCVSVNIGGLGSVGVGVGLSGKGTPEIYSFNVGEITEIRSAIFSNIEHSTTLSETVTLEIQPNLIQYITVEESGGILTVHANRNINWSPSNTPVLTVGTPSLERVMLAGAGTFTAKDTLTVDTFNIEFAGAGSGKADLDVSKVVVNLSGAGDFRLSGRADNADFTLAGAGRIEALDLQTQTSSINLAGAGTVRVTCHERMSVIAAGVGTVEYKGSPAIDTARGGLVVIRNVD